ncbi:MAG: LysR family transcriptional regulator [Gammaproteobacteria bacterium]|nr:LysR family transcriptional regulator [Gammaproteobacteria bacterium]
MTLTELRYIIAVAREHHFGRAAQACNVSQPTLSVAIKKLEDELGVAIFERGSNEIRLSPIGERIVEQAQQTLEAAEGVRQIAQQGKNQLSGPLKIGAIHTIGPYLYPELIPLIRSAAPEMPLIVEENYTSVLTEKLKSGKLDLIFIALPYDEHGIVCRPLYKEPFVVLLPASHPLCVCKTINSSMLENENVLLLGKGHCFRDHVLEACPACVPKPGLKGDLPHTVEGSSLETIRHMVVSGLGITVLPCTAAGAHSYTQRLLAIRRFSNPIPSRTVALAWRVSFTRPKVIDIITSAVNECNLSCVKLL